MAGDHKCPVCGSTFTRSQHVARHMRSHTGDRPYKCVHCGDQFARSDLLSRHVNKCHTNEKKSGGNSGRVRKHRQPSTSIPAPAPQPPLANPPAQQPQSLFQHQRQPQFTHPTTSDPFHPGPQLYTPHNANANAYPPRAFDSASHPSSASVSLDNLSTSLPYTLPTTAPNYLPRTQNAYLPGYRQTTATTAAPTHFEHSVAKHNDSNIFANPPPQNGFTDLSTSLAYPYKHRAGSNGSSDGHSNTSNNPTYGGYGQVQGYGSEGNATGLAASNPMSYIPQPNLEAPNAPDGGFSSSFGLMSLEDPAVLAGVSSGVPFFDNNMTPHHQQDLHALFPSQIFDWNAPSLGGGPNSSDVTPGTREREANQLRELWSSFLRDPTARLNSDGTEVQRPDFPTPSLHRRSSSYSGPGKPGNNNNNNSGNNGYQQLSTSSTKTPYMPGPQQPLAGGANIVAQLEAQAARDQQQRMQQQPKAAPLVAHVASHASPEALKSYEEAILARKAPILKLPPKLKVRDVANTASGSSVLPSISQTNRSIPGSSGGVASLASGAQFPTLAAASSVPPGSTPNQGLAALQQHGQQHGGLRLVLPLPKPRSRPSTSTGHYSSDQSPTSLTHSAPPTPVHMHNAPSSRPGTSAGQYAQVDSRPVTSTSGGLNASASNESRPSTGGSNASNSNWQPGYAAHPGSGQMLPPPHVPNQEKNLAEYNAAMSAALIIRGHSGTSPAPGRPSYKRLASQILESAAIKRARDDLNNTSAIEDDDEDEEHHLHPQREGSTESNEPGSSAAVSSMGSHSGHSSSFGHEVASFAEYRRMSEPSSNARAYPRPGSLVVAHSNVGPSANEVARVSPPGTVAAPGVRKISMPPA